MPVDSFFPICSMEKNLSSLDLKRLPSRRRSRSELGSKAILLDEMTMCSFGNPGSGKSHVACAIGQELIRSGRKVMFATCALMVQDLLAAKRDQKPCGLLKKISRYEVLILDEVPICTIQPGRDGGCSSTCWRNGTSAGA